MIQKSGLEEQQPRENRKKKKLPKQNKIEWLTINDKEMYLKCIFRQTHLLKMT